MPDKDIIKKIDQYIRGGLSAREIDKLWIKFLINPEYFDWFETELHLRHLIQKNRPSRIHSLISYKKSILKDVKTWILAAAAMVAISFGLQFFGSSVQDLAIRQIEPSELMGADVLRSDTQQADPLDIAINEALATAYEDEIEEAIARFRNIMEAAPAHRQRVRVEMNLGILHYNESEYQQAAEHFKALTGLDLQSKYIEEKSWWYLANSYLNLGQLEDAQEAAFTTYSLDGRYKSPAKILLDRLYTELGTVLSDDPRPDSNSE